MTITVYVLEVDPLQAAWITEAIAPAGHACVLLANSATLFEQPPDPRTSCLVTSVGPDAAPTPALVRALRAKGVNLPVIVLGPHDAFRTAVAIARLAATDFLERPVGARQLREAISTACPTRLSDPLE